MLFTIPDDEREQRIEEWVAGQKRNTTHAVERARLLTKLDRIRQMYMEAELDETDYRRLRVETEARLAEIPPDDVVTPKRVSKRLAALLANMAETWKVATPVERNAIARELFFDVVIDNRAVVAVKPRPEMAPYFQQIPGLARNDCQVITQQRKRRDSKLHALACRRRPSYASYSLILHSVVVA